MFYHGMEYSAEYAAMKSLYETPSAEELQRWDVEYVLFDGNVFARFAADENWYAQRYPLWYENGSVRIYQIS